MAQHPTITERYKKPDRFVTTLVVAELNASTDWEIEFTNDLRDRFEQYGAQMMLSDLQKTQLDRIATND